MQQGLIELIETNADKLTKELVEELRKREETKHYQDIPEDVLYERVRQVIYNVYARLGNWMNKTRTKDVIFAYYSELGKERFMEGIPLHEVVISFMLIKRKIYEYAMANKITETTGADQITEIWYFISLFFDRVIHSTIVGYEDVMRNTLTK
jgi:hypothetical protein